MTFNYGVKFHHENIPEFMFGVVDELYVRLREKAVGVFNTHISEVNEEWNKTGKPASFGQYLEDVNPEYVALIKDRIQPEIDRIITSGLVKIRIDDYGNLEGYLPVLKGSRVYVTLYEMN